MYIKLVVVVVVVVVAVVVFVVVVVVETRESHLIALFAFLTLVQLRFHHANTVRLMTITAITTFTVVF